MLPEKTNISARVEITLKKIVEESSFTHKDAYELGAMLIAIGDAQGNKTTTTDRTIHRKGDYERNATYEARLKHQEEIISWMQHTIDSLVLSNKLNVDTHLAKKDSTNVVKETDTKDIKPASTSMLISLFLFWAAAVGICTWLYNKR